jgi:hypothetical protein
VVADDNIQVMGCWRYTTKPHLRSKFDEFFPPEPYPYPEDFEENGRRKGKRGCGVVDHGRPTQRLRASSIPRASPDRLLRIPHI